MPVIPVFAAIGTALGASAATAATVGAVVTTSVVATGVGAAMSALAASKQAKMAAKVADYNAKVDIVHANQIAMNENANIAKQRLKNAAYLSEQRSQYAASGILGGTGSPLALEATTVGRMEQDIQQDWTNVQTQESNLYSAAKFGIYEGQQESEMYHLEGAADIFKGIGGIANIIGGAYNPGDGST